MNIIIAGIQGSGKGTHAEILSKELHIPHISVGEIFRNKGIDTTKGELIPSHITNKLVEERLLEEDCISGFILDGYPRNIEQANFLNKIINIDKIILLELSEEKAIKRIESRRICINIEKPYTTNLNDKKCLQMGGKLVQREDDKPEAIQKRINIYKNETLPALMVFEDTSDIISIDSDQSIEEVQKDIIEKL